MSKRKRNEAEGPMKKIKVRCSPGCHLSSRDFESGRAEVQNMASQTNKNEKAVEGEIPEPFIIHRYGKPNADADYITDDREAGMKYFDDVIYIKTVRPCKSTQVTTEECSKRVKTVSSNNTIDLTQNEEDADVIWVSTENLVENKAQTNQPAGSHQLNHKKTPMAEIMFDVIDIDDEDNELNHTKISKIIHTIDSKRYMKHLKRTNNSPIFHGQEKIPRREKPIQHTQFEIDNARPCSSQEENTTYYKISESSSATNYQTKAVEKRFKNTINELCPQDVSLDRKNACIISLKTLADSEYCKPEPVTHQIVIQKAYTLVKPLVGKPQEDETDQDRCKTTKVNQPKCIDTNTEYEEYDNDVIWISTEIPAENKAEDQVTGNDCSDGSDADTEYDNPDDDYDSHSDDEEGFLINDSLSCSSSDYRLPGHAVMYMTLTPKGLMPPGYVEAQSSTSEFDTSTVMPIPRLSESQPLVCQPPADRSSYDVPQEGTGVIDHSVSTISLPALFIRPEKIETLKPINILSTSMMELNKKYLEEAYQYKSKPQNHIHGGSDSSKMTLDDIPSTLLPATNELYVDDTDHIHFMTNTIFDALLNDGDDEDDYYSETSTSAHKLINDDDQSGNVENVEDVVDISDGYINILSTCDDDQSSIEKSTVS